MEATTDAPRRQLRVGTEREPQVPARMPSVACWKQNGSGTEKGLHGSIHGFLWQMIVYLSTSAHISSRSRQCRCRVRLLACSLRNLDILQEITNRPNVTAALYNRSLVLVRYFLVSSTLKAPCFNIILSFSLHVVLPVLVLVRVPTRTVGDCTGTRTVIVWYRTRVGINTIAHISNDTTLPSPACFILGG